MAAEIRAGLLVLFGSFVGSGPGVRPLDLLFLDGSLDPAQLLDLVDGETDQPGRNLQVTLEFPVDLININEEDAEFQVCTGPVVLPDLAAWDGSEVHRVFLADAAISGFDHAEFILRREIEAAEREKHWYEAPRGRDRLELNDPENPPPDYPPRRPRPLVYNETWEKETENVILKTKNAD